MDCLFVVRDKKEYVNVNVYGVTDDSNGYPKFLIRDKNQWIWRSAKYFEPVM